MSLTSTLTHMFWRLLAILASPGIPCHAMVCLPVCPPLLLELLVVDVFTIKFWPACVIGTHMSPCMECPRLLSATVCQPWVPTTAPLCPPAGGDRFGASTPQQEVHLGCSPLTSPAAAYPDPSPSFTRIASAATGAPLKLLCDFCACLRPLWHTLVMLPISEPLYYHSTARCSFLILLVLFCAASISSSMISSAFLATSRTCVHQSLCLLLQAAPVVPLIVHHVNKLLFTPVVSFLFHGLGYAYQLVSPTLQNLESDFCCFYPPPPPDLIQDLICCSLWLWSSKDLFCSSFH